MQTQNKIRVTNPNKFMVGIIRHNGVESKVHPNSFVILDPEDIYYINNMSSVFSRRMLLIDNDEINEDLGLKEKTVMSFSREEIEKLLRGNIKAFKEALPPEKTEKHMLDKVVEVALTIDDLAMNKINYLDETFGIKLEIIKDNMEQMNNATKGKK